MKELLTERLNLIALNYSHANDLFAIYSDELAMKYWDGFPHKTIADTEKLLAMLSERIEKGTGLSWGITLKESPGKVIGTIAYNRYQKNGLAVVGAILSQDYWKQGFMTEALKEFIEYGFDTLGIHRIEAHVQPGNIGSEKSLLKIGFKNEGLLRERHFYKGTHQDSIIYGLLKTDERNR